MSIWRVKKICCQAVPVSPLLGSRRALPSKLCELSGIVHLLKIIEGKEASFPWYAWLTVVRCHKRNECSLWACEFLMVWLQFVISSYDLYFFSSSLFWWILMNYLWRPAHVPTRKLLGLKVGEMAAWRTTVFEFGMAGCAIGIHKKIRRQDGGQWQSNPEGYSLFYSYFTS